MHESQEELKTCVKWNNHPWIPADLHKAIPDLGNGLSRASSDTHADQVLPGTSKSPGTRGRPRQRHLGQKLRCHPVLALSLLAIFDISEIPLGLAQSRPDIMELVFKTADPSRRRLMRPALAFGGPRRKALLHSTVQGLQRHSHRFVAIRNSIKRVVELLEEIPQARATARRHQAPDAADTEGNAGGRQYPTLGGTVKQAAGGKYVTTLQNKTLK